MSRLLIAAPKSGSGKTIITCALINILKNRGLKVVSFKCGPDYIDPIFHKAVLEIPSRNIDIFMSDNKIVLNILGENTKNGEFGLIEGVMGYYDGIGGISTAASSYEISSLSNTPVLLVYDVKGSSLTAAAVIKGMAEFKKDSNIKAVLLNRATEGVYNSLKNVIENETGVKVIGYLPELKDCEFKSRYLGLSLGESKEKVLEKINNISTVLEKTVDIEYLINLSKTAPEINFNPEKIEPFAKGVKIAVAYDEAFNFYYEDNIDYLVKAEVEIEYFSPLKNESVPKDSDGLIIGGGYPEMFAKELSENLNTKNSVIKAIKSGIPLIAECGGFMYLNKAIKTDDGKFEMCGIFNSVCQNTNRLTHFGYVELTAQENSVFGSAGTKLKGHEFHYYHCENEGHGFKAQKPLTGKSWQCAFTNENMYAGFPHLYFYSNIEAVNNYLNRCIEFKSRCYNEFK